MWRLFSMANILQPKTGNFCRKRFSYLIFLFDIDRYTIYFVAFSYVLSALLLYERYGLSPAVGPCTGLEHDYNYSWNKINFQTVLIISLGNVPSILLAFEFCVETESRCSMTGQNEKSITSRWIVVDSPGDSHCGNQHILHIEMIVKWIFTWMMSQLTTQWVDNVIWIG